MAEYRQYPIAKEGWCILAALGALAWLTEILFGMWVIIPLILLLFTAYFFRNPDRSIPDGLGIYVSPADGTVMKIESTYEARYLNADSQKVTIFLSLFNVHINRSPAKGRVEYIEKVPGKFVPANRSEAGDINARNYLGLETEYGKVLVAQITGLIARRIVCRARVGDVLDRGDRYGLIRFGSCTEVFLPHDTEIVVSPGDKVKGGITILGRIAE